MKMVTGAGLALLGVMSCSAGDSREEAGDQEGRIPAPTVEIVTPTEGAETGPELEVQLEATGIAIVPATGIRVPGEAHFHLYLDTDPAADRTQAVGQADGVIHLGSGVANHTYRDLAPGPHRVIAVLGWGDHVPVADAATDTVSFTVGSPTPQP